MKRTYDLDDATLNSLELLPQYTLGRDWVPPFILRHPYLTVAIRRRIKSIRMDRATKPVLDAFVGLALHPHHLSALYSHHHIPITLFSQGGANITSVTLSGLYPPPSSP